MLTTEMGRTKTNGELRSGFEVLTTCSPSNFDYVKSLGADVVFDYNSPTWTSDVRAHTDDKLYYIWDCIGTPASYATTPHALSTSPPEGQELRYGTIVTPPEGRNFGSEVKVTHTLGYSVSGEAFRLGSKEFPARQEDYDFMVEWYKIALELLEQGKWKPHRLDVRDGGLEGIFEGLKDMEEGRVSGVKVVYRIGEP